MHLSGIVNSSSSKEISIVNGDVNHRFKLSRSLTERNRRKQSRGLGWSYKLNRPRRNLTVVRAVYYYSNESRRFDTNNHEKELVDPSSMHPENFRRRPVSRNHLGKLPCVGARARCAGLLARPWEMTRVLFPPLSGKLLLSSLRPSFCPTPREPGVAATRVETGRRTNDEGAGGRTGGKQCFLNLVITARGRTRKITRGWRGLVCGARGAATRGHSGGRGSRRT